MKVQFYQSKDEGLSINLLFGIIKENFPVSLNFSTVYFTYTGPSIPARIYDVFAGFFQSQKQINHVIGDFNYATFLMPKSRTILTIHDLYRLYVHQASRSKVFIFKWFWLKIPLSKCSVVTTISQCTKNEIIKYSGCRDDKIRVIYNCISPDFAPIPKSFNKEKPVLLQIGTRINKNVERLVRAIEGISCKLFIVGKPSRVTMELLEHNKVDYSWESQLSRKQIIEQYANCDMLVFVSTFEGFGMPIVEANAIERAVVTSNISAMPEIAGGAACLVDPFDVASIRQGILRVIEDDTYRQKLIDEGKKNRQRFEARNIAEQYYNLYLEIYQHDTLSKITKN
ncbi:MAG: glycosyltransferase family 1 protein [Ferruginibacter sp.]